MAPLTPPANPPKDSSAPHPGGDFGTPLVSRGNNDDPHDSEDDESFLPSLQAAASERVPGTLGMFLYSLFSRKSARNGKISARETSSAYFAYVKVLVRQQPVSAVFMFITLGALAVAYATLPVFINLAFRIVYLSPGVRGVSLDKFAQWVGLYSLCIFICATVFERTFLYARAGLMRDVSLLALQFSEMDDDVSDEQLEGFLTTDADEFRRFAHHAHQLVLFSTAAGACFLASLVEVPQLASVLLLFAFAYLVIDVACGVVSSVRKTGAGATPRRRAESIVKAHMERQVTMGHPVNGQTQTGSKRRELQNSLTLKKRDEGTFSCFLSPDC